MAGGLLDDPELIAAAATDVGLDPRARSLVRDSPRSRTRCTRTSRAARSPSPAARALDHKLGGPPRGAPLHGAELRAQLGGRTFSLPGFNPVEAYEAAIANLDPALTRRPKPGVGRRELLALGRRAARDGRGRGDHGRDGRLRTAARPRGAADPGRRGLLLEALKHARVVLVAAHLVADDGHPRREARMSRHQCSATPAFAAIRAARAAPPSPRSAPVEPVDRARQVRVEREDRRARATATGIGDVRMVAAALELRVVLDVVRGDVQPAADRDHRAR